MSCRDGEAGQSFPHRAVRLQKCKLSRKKQFRNSRGYLPLLKWCLSVFKAIFISLYGTVPARALTLCASPSLTHTPTHTPLIAMPAGGFGQDVLA